MIKEVLQTKVTNFKTIPALVQHIKPKISNLINMGFDVNDKKMYKQLKSIKNISRKIEKLDINNKDDEKIISKLEQEIKYYDENKNKRWNVTGIIKVKEIYYAKEDNTYVYGNHYKCAENCSKIRGRTPRPARLQYTESLTSTDDISLCHL
jgi:hypothetical protein